jgi:hypothetical protein
MAVPPLADNPRAEPAELAQRWIQQRLKLKKNQQILAQAIQQTLEDSPDAVLKAFYISAFARAKHSCWHPNGDWISDDLIDASAAWRMIMRLPDSALDGVVLEKQEAVERIAEDRGNLQHQMDDANHKLLEPLVNSLIYAESLFEALRDLIQGLVTYRRYLRQKDPALAETCRNRMLSTQSRWQHHTQRHSSLPGCATAFREDNLWEMTQRILDEVSNDPGS